MGWMADLRRVPRVLLAFQLAQLLDAFGSNMWALIFPLITASMTHSAFWTTLVTGGSFAAAPLAPWLGRLVDGADKRQLWQRTTGLEAIVVALFAVTVRSDHQLWLYVVMAVFLGITARLRRLCLGPVFQSYVPRDARVGFQSFASTVVLVAGYAGPGLGGILLPWLGPAHALEINAASDVVPLLMSGWMPTVPGVVNEAVPRWSDYIAWRQISALRWVLGVRWLRLALGGGITAILLYYLRETMGLASGWIGVAAATSGLIPLAVGPMTPGIVRRFRTKTILYAMLGLAGIGYGALALCHTWWQVAAAAGVAEATLIPESTLESVLMQQYIPTAQYAHARGLISMVSSLGAILCTVIFSVAATVVPLRVMIAGAGILLVGAAVLVARHTIGSEPAHSIETMAPPQ